MEIISIPNYFKPEVKRHHKHRHMKKMAIGPYAVDCLELRFAADVERFEELDDALVTLEADNGWDIFHAYFDNQDHVAVSYFADLEERDQVLSKVKAVVEGFFPLDEAKVYHGDANYGDWPSIT
ncbi:hypothetical protein [Aliagarivorans marinus]|uniref:hypothetical protein n=1 Tax=Aliagarivorans marinus TaxID=561965 RepID=UPI0004255D95|nr:hypothetical protein [Aliagarivorans marinus]